MIESSIIIPGGGNLFMQAFNKGTCVYLQKESPRDSIVTFHPNLRPAMVYDEVGRYWLDLEGEFGLWQ